MPDIIPTVGRKVWYTPGDWNTKAGVVWRDQPLDATIVYVWNESMVNLACYDANGVPFVQTSCVRWNGHADASAEERAGSWDWMPYQRAQVAKDVAPAAAAA
jgi:hypothetical protein